MKSKVRHLFAALVVMLPFMAMVPASANEGGSYEKAPIDIKDTESLQRGAQIFANYCLSCHSASMLRYNRLTDIGLSEQQIKDNLMFASDKIGDQMNVAMNKKDAAVWLGAAPPDLSLIARSRTADYLYAYLRGFYKDPSRPTGWNNLVFDKVGMPHVLWELQGEQVLKVSKDAEGNEVRKLELVKPGTLSKVEFDHRMADLTNFLVYMGEPAQVHRYQIGYIVLMFFGLLLFPLAYFLKREYWKDLH